MDQLHSDSTADAILHVTLLRFQRYCIRSEHMGQMSDDGARLMCLCLAGVMFWAARLIGAFVGLGSGCCTRRILHAFYVVWNAVVMYAAT